MGIESGLVEQRNVFMRELERKLNSLAGVVTNGIFAERPADVLLLAGDDGVTTIT